MRGSPAHAPAGVVDRWQRDGHQYSDVRSSDLRRPARVTDTGANELLCVYDDELGPPFTDRSALPSQPPVAKAESYRLSWTTSARDDFASTWPYLIPGTRSRQRSCRSHISRTHHVCSRSLHRLFQNEGTTVGGWIRQQRLNHRRPLGLPLPSFSPGPSTVPSTLHSAIWQHIAARRDENPGVAGGRSRSIRPR